MLFPKHPAFAGLLRPPYVSPRRKEGPPNIWDTSGIPGNVFSNPQASSSAPYPQELNSEEEACGFEKTFPDMPDVSQIFGGPSLRRGDT